MQNQLKCNSVNIIYEDYPRCFSFGEKIVEVLKIFFIFPLKKRKRMLNYFILFQIYSPKNGLACRVVCFEILLKTSRPWRPYWSPLNVC